MASKKPPNLSQITKSFERAYNAAEKSADRKAQAQKRFFDAIDQTLEEQVRKQQIVPFTGTEDEPVETFIARQHPGWRLRRVTDSGEIIIEEDPKFMKFSFTNKELGVTFQRTTAQASNSIDDERLRKENPRLWEQITEWPEPWYSMIYNFAESLGPDLGPNDIHNQLDIYLRNMGLGRVLKNPDDWSDAEFRALSKYIVPGPVSTRLVKPRPATPEELNGQGI